MQIIVANLMLNTNIWVLFLASPTVEGEKINKYHIYIIYRI